MSTGTASSVNWSDEIHSRYGIPIGSVAHASLLATAELGTDQTDAAKRKALDEEAKIMGVSQRQVTNDGNSAVEAVSSSVSEPDSQA